MKKIIRNQWKRTFNVQSASSVNSLFCSQSVNLQHQQTSDASSASTDNRWISIFRKFKQSSMHSTISASNAKLSTFYREWRCSQLTATDFRNRQSSACIWSFHDRVQQSDNQTIVSASNFIAIECSNLDINCLSFDRGGAGCNFSDTRQLPVHLTVSQSGAAILTSQTTSPVHLIVSRSDAAILTSQTTAPVHLIVSSLGAAFLTSHSFDHFFTSSGIVDRSHTHSFYQVFLKKDINHWHFNQRPLSYRM